ncbi:MULTISPECIES: hypothetical protein [Micromonospora]|uniref:hypothetical protein n=1 Tax=unclassified Micromonospora TaxID=2617518 RepID=UPI001E64045B|nr:hypothetical protein [Micromonospora sp. NBRC 110038]
MALPMPSEVVKALRIARGAYGSTVGLGLAVGLDVTVGLGLAVVGSGTAELAAARVGRSSPPQPAADKTAISATAPRRIVLWRMTNS